MKDQSKRYSEGSSLFITGIPHSVKAAFKAACSLREKSMRDTLISLMRRHVHEVEKGK